METIRPPHTVLYPTHRVLGIVDDEASAEKLKELLSEVGLADRLWILDGPSTARALDTESPSDGFWQLLVRKIQSIASYEADQMLQYQNETANGAYLFGVSVKEHGDDMIAKVTELFRRVGGHHVRHYGTTVVSNLHQAPSAL